jgi:hypothetical protein
MSFPSFGQIHPRLYLVAPSVSTYQLMPTALPSTLCLSSFSPSI